MRKAILVGLMLLGATGAQGQLVGLNHIWTVPGAMNTSLGISTFISCTNLSGTGETIGVDVFGPGGAFISMGSLAVSPNATVIFGTSSSPSLSVDVNLATGTFTKGYARVMSTASKGVLCSAFLEDTANLNPSAISSLTIAKKTKQKGD